MPNFKGGKKYKAGKHSESKLVFHEINEAEGQMVGRVLKSLGDRNMLVYCNDGVERICHIRGGLRKKDACIEVGDLILISLRNENMLVSQTTKEKGDILAKYERELHSMLKKMDGMNPRLFVQMEIMDAKARASGITPVQADDGFDFEYDNEDGEDEGSDGPERDPAAAAEAREKKKMMEEKKRAASRAVKEKEPDNDDIDIDAI